MAATVLLVTAGERNGMTAAHVRVLFDGLRVGRVFISDRVGSSAFALFPDREAKDEALRRRSGDLVVSQCTMAAAQAVVATEWDYAACPEKQWDVRAAGGATLHILANAAAQRVQSWVGGETVRDGAIDGVTSVPFSLFAAVPSFRMHLPQAVAAHVCAHLEAHRRVPAAGLAAVPPPPSSAPAPAVDSDARQPSGPSLRAQLARAALRADDAERRAEAAHRRADDNAATLAGVSQQRDRLLALSKQHLSLQQQQAHQAPSVEAIRRERDEARRERNELQRANGALLLANGALERKEAKLTRAAASAVDAAVANESELRRELDLKAAGTAHLESTKEAMLALLEQKAVALQAAQQHHSAVLSQREADVAEARALARVEAVKDYRAQAEAARARARQEMEGEVRAARAALEERSVEASELATTNEGMLSLLEDKTIALRQLKSEHERVLSAHAEQLVAMRDDMEAASRAAKRAALEKQKAQAMREMHRLRNAAKGELDRVVKGEREVQRKLEMRIAAGHDEALTEGALEQRARAKQRVASLKRAHAAAVKQHAAAHAEELERRLASVQLEQRKRMLTIGAEHEAVLKECEATYSMLDELRAEHRRQLASAEARAREEKAAALLRQRHAAQQTLRDAIAREQHEKRSALMRSQSKLNELASKLGDIEVRSKRGESRSPAPAKPATPGVAILPRAAATPGAATLRAATPRAATPGPATPAAAPVAL